MVNDVGSPVVKSPRLIVTVEFSSIVIVAELVCGAAIEGLDFAGLTIKSTGGLEYINNVIDKKMRDKKFFIRDKVDKYIYKNRKNSNKLKFP